MAQLTSDQVAVAFRAQMPQMRSKFKRTLRDFLWDLTKAPDHNLERLLDMLEDETNARLALAEKGVRDLLDSGWQPTPQESIRTVYLKIFEVRDHTQDPSSDLYAAADRANALMPQPNPLGQPNPIGKQTPRLRLGRIQVDAYNASIARSEAHVVKEQPPVGHTFLGPTQFIAGSGNTAHFTNVVGNIDARSIANATTIVREHIGEFAEDDRDDVQVHLATVEDEMVKPEPNVGRIRAAWRAVQKLAGAGASAALSATIEAVVKNVLSGG
jgi:hypothetical protein